MIVKSNFKDYYDGIQSIDRSPEPLYLRHTRREGYLYGSDVKLTLALDKYHRWSPLREIPWKIILFCGKAYYMTQSSLNRPCCVNIRAYARDIKHNWRLSEEHIQECEKFLDESQGHEVQHDIFHAFKSPIIEIDYLGNDEDDDDDIMFIVNPQLKDTKMPVFYNPMEAWQEISMFLGNVLTELDESPVTVGSDEIVAKQKGFDDYSFRTKSPGRRKLRRKENKKRKRME